MDFKGKLNLPNPRESTNPISKLLFWWIVPLFRKGAKKGLVLDDVYNVISEDSSDKLGNELAKAWDKELQRSKMKHQKPKFYKAIVSVFGVKYLFSGFLFSLNEWILKVVQSLCLKWLIESFAQESKENHKLNQYIYAGVICLTTLVNTVLMHPTIFAWQHIGMKIRVACSSLIYRKVLRISRVTNQSSIGQLVNLLSNDVNRFDINLNFLHYFYIGPIQLIIFSYFLWKEFGPSSMAGTGLIILLTPAQYYVGKLFTIYRFRIAEKTDQRGKIMSEIIIAMRVLKMYTWEKPFGDLIDQIRRLEVKILRKAAYVRGFNLSLYYSLSKFITFLTFLTYVLIDENNTLRADKVFFAVSLYNTMRQSMITFVPNAAAQTGELIVSVKRIENFLVTSEQNVSKNLQLVHKSGINNGDGNGNKKPMIQMENACSSWTKDKITLDNLNMLLEGDKLVIVCGPVGSGKTSFLHALIAELPITKGKCIVQGKTTYASQEPWIFSGNLKQNILFGQEYDESRYNKVIENCALEDDLKQLAHGDNTVVGERGVSLSGGQKARVNLARALYKPSDIYFLDDPLSAVDTRVSRLLFEKCIKNFLKGSLRVLVTHQLQYLPQADHIIVFNEGRILAQGNYQSLVDEGVDFVSLMSNETDEYIGNRRESTISIVESITLNSMVVELDKDQQENPIEQKEEMAVGSVNFKLYWEYFRSGKSTFGMFMLCCGFLFSQVLVTVCELWLSLWTNEEVKRADQTLESPIISTTIVSTDDKNYLGRNTYIYVYSVITVAIFIVTQSTSVYFFHYCMKIGRNIHNLMFRAIVRSPTKFFDDNPSGRVMNRFTKDLGSIDELLPFVFFDALTVFFLLVGVLLVIVISNYYMILPTVGLCTAFVYMRRFYIPTARDVKRIEAIARSPLFTHLAASVQGLTTIRSSNSQNILIQQFDGYQDFHSGAWYIFISSNRWFGIWLELISIIYLTIVTLTFLVLPNGVMSGNVGLAITSVMTLMSSLQWGMRQSAETENQMTSVERALEYSKLKPEAPLDSPPDKKPPKKWPTEGKIEFQNLCLAYEDKVVLKDLTFEIKEKEKIGIVGRTGAGKSSIIGALFRMTEPTGEIWIDGVRVNDIGLHDLRRNISIIPQDPVLFSGTIRYNLDPFDQFKDPELWEVLSEVDLKGEIPSLDYKVYDSGSNFSVGQRQLVCLARAILRKNLIIVMDEATANVDPRTDNLIQKTIRQKFANCTIITIAHRLHSVMDCDRILVLDNGFLKEYDHPHILLQNPNGILSSMIRNTGKASTKILLQVAAETYFGRRASFGTGTLEILGEVNYTSNQYSDSDK